MLQDTYSYDQYKWKNLIYKENCIKCAALESAYVCSFGDVEWKYCVKCGCIACADKKLLSRVYAVLQGHAKVSSVFASTAGIPPEMYTRWGASPRGDTLLEGLKGFMGVCPAPAVRELTRHCGTCLARVGRSRHLANYLAVKEGQESSGSELHQAWVWMLPVSVVPGLQTGWFVLSTTGVGDLVTFRHKGLPEPEHIIINLPQDIQYQYTLSSLQSALGFASMESLKKVSNTLLTIRVDNLDYRRI